MAFAIKSHVQLCQIQLRKSSRHPSQLCFPAQNENVKANGTDIPLGDSRAKLFLKQRVLRSP